MRNLQQAWPVLPGVATGRGTPGGIALLTDGLEASRRDFKEFATANVEPFAGQWDREQRLPDSVISLLGTSGYLGCCLPPDYGGRGWDTVTFGLLNEALGRESPALAG